MFIKKKIKTTLFIDNRKERGRQCLLNARGTVSVNKKLRYFFMKKKFFLVRNLRGAFTSLNRKTNAKGSLLKFKGLALPMLSLSKHLLDNWCLRLKKSVTLRTHLGKAREQRYSIKKRFKKLNLSNRYVFQKKNEFSLTRKELTLFFLKTKNINKLSIVNNVYLNKTNAVGPLVGYFYKPNYFLLSKLGLLTGMFKKTWSQFVLYKRLLNFLRLSNSAGNLYKSKTYAIGHLHRKKTQTFLKKKTKYAAQKYATRWWSKRYRKLKKKNKRAFLFRKSFFIKKNINVIGRDKSIQLLKHRRRPRKLHPNRGTSTLPTTKTNVFYDFRTLVSFNIGKSSYRNSLSINFSKLNLFNFRTFNWQIIN